MKSEFIQISVCTNVAISPLEDQFIFLFTEYKVSWPHIFITDVIF